MTTPMVSIRRGREPIPRRRILIGAVAAGLIGGPMSRLLDHQTETGFIWRGAALGGEAKIQLFSHDHDQAKVALTAVSDEIQRLENIFSLHRPASELSRLNRDGFLRAPSRDLLEVLRNAIDWRRRTHGSFDPTVQTIWRAAAAGRPMTSELVATSQASINVTGDLVSIGSRVSLTLNGIAQGRIADRVTELLMSYGFKDVIVDAGEVRLPGRRPRSVALPGLASPIRCAEVAVATSAPSQLYFDPGKTRHHLIDPRTGESPSHWRSLSVFAPDAESADALSTGLAVLPPDAVVDVVGSMRGIAVVAADANGIIRRFGRLDGFRGRLS